jgi:hypothetical protein
MRGVSASEGCTRCTEDGDMQCKEVNRYRTGCSRQEVQEVHRVLGGPHADREQLGCGTVIVFGMLDTMRAQSGVGRFDVTSGE